MLRQARLWLVESYEAQGKLWQAGEQYRAMVLTNPSDEEAL
jgi:TolA-binding protein